MYSPDRAGAGEVLPQDCFQWFVTNTGTQMDRPVLIYIFRALAGQSSEPNTKGSGCDWDATPTVAPAAIAIAVSDCYAVSSTGRYAAVTCARPTASRIALEAPVQSLSPTYPVRMDRSRQTPEEICLQNNVKIVGELRRFDKWLLVFFYSQHITSPRVIKTESGDDTCVYCDYNVCELGRESSHASSHATSRAASRVASRTTSPIRRTSPGRLQQSSSVQASIQRKGLRLVILRFKWEILPSSRILR
ncbi:hypothetical protein V8E54_014901 [Elaphomyces granulatus]